MRSMGASLTGERLELGAVRRGRCQRQGPRCDGRGHRVNNVRRTTGAIVPHPAISPHRRRRRPGPAARQNGSSRIRPMTRTRCALVNLHVTTHGAVAEPRGAPIARRASAACRANRRRSLPAFRGSHPQEPPRPNLRTRRHLSQRCPQPELLSGASIRCLAVVG